MALSAGKEAKLLETVSVVQLDQSQSTADKSVVVIRATDGNGALTWMTAVLDLAEHVPQTSTKTKPMVPAYDVLKKLPPFLSLKTASVQLNCLGMERAV